MRFHKNIVVVLMTFGVGLMAWQSCSSMPVWRVKRKVDLPKERIVGSALRAFTAISNIASRSAASEDNERNTKRYGLQARSIVSRLKHPRQLGTLAALCRAVLFSQTAEDKTYDHVFDETFWICVQRLSKSADPDAVEELRRLERTVEGGDKFHFHLLVDKQGRSLSAMTSGQPCCL